MESVSIFTEARAEHTPFGVTWSARAWVADLCGGQHFAAERHGHASPTAAADAARAGTAILWREYLAETAARHEAEADAYTPSTTREAHGYADENGDYI